MEGAAPVRGLCLGGHHDRAAADRSRWTGLAHAGSWAQRECHL